MIYQRHLINTLITPLIITLTIIVSLVWLSQIMKLAYVIELGVGITKFIFLTIAALPTIALSTLPLASIVACFFGYNYLHSDRELIALSAAGLSNMDISKPAIKLAGVMTLICYLLAFYISPASYHMLKEDMSYLRGNYISGIVHEHTFNQLSKNVVLFVDEKQSSGKMSGIIIFDNRNTKSPITVFARLGELSVSNGTPVFKLHDGIRQEIDKKGNMNQMKFSHLVIALPSKHDIRSKASRDLQEYTINDLLYPGDKYTPARLNQIIAEKHQRFTWPGYVLALVILTLAVYLREPHSRTGHKLVIIKVAIAVTIPLYLHFTFHNMASEKPIFNLFCYLNLLTTIVVGWAILRQGGGGLVPNINA